jgi:hypothetical protein
MTLQFGRVYFRKASERKACVDACGSEPTARMCCERECILPAPLDYDRRVVGDSRDTGGGQGPCGRMALYHLDRARALGLDRKRERALGEFKKFLQYSEIAYKRAPPDPPPDHWPNGTAWPMVRGGKVLSVVATLESLPPQFVMSDGTKVRSSLKAKARP